MLDNLLEAYRYHRQRNKRAWSAWELALEDVKTGKKRYASGFTPYSAYNPATDAFGFKACRWIENTSRAGLRRVGTYDEICRKHGNYRGHLGWYLDDDGWQTAVPVVFRLPARNGQGVFAYGYDDPNNEGAAFLCFANDTEDELEAARFAYKLTERMAETERDYQRAWQAGRQYEDLAQEISAKRVTVRELARELKTVAIPAKSLICGTLRASINRLFTEINEAREQREKLFEDYGQQTGFVE